MNNRARIKTALDLRLVKRNIMHSVPPQNQASHYDAVCSVLSGSTGWNARLVFLLGVARVEALRNAVGLNVRARSVL